MDPTRRAPDSPPERPTPTEAPPHRSRPWPPARAWLGDLLAVLIGGAFVLALAVFAVLFGEILTRLH